MWKSFKSHAGINSFFGTLGSPFRNVLSGVQQQQPPIQPQTTPFGANDHILTFGQSPISSNLLVFNSQSLNNLSLTGDTVSMFTGNNQEPRVLFKLALLNSNNQSTPNSFQSVIEPSY